MRDLPVRVVRPLDKSIPIIVTPEIRRVHEPRLSDKQIGARERTQVMLAYMRFNNGRSFTCADLVAEFGGSHATIIKYLSKLMRRKLVETSGRKGLRYFYWASNSTEEFI